MLASMAIAVLVLGAIVTFVTSCIEWKSYGGFDEINWMGIPGFVNILMITLVGWALLNVMVDISVNIRTLRILKVSDSVEAKNDDEWKKEFAVLITLKQKDKARELLYRRILTSNSFKHILGNKNQATRDVIMKDLNDSFSTYLRAIGENSFNVEHQDSIYNAFK